MRFNLKKKSEVLQQTFIVLLNFLKFSSKTKPINFTCTLQTKLKIITLLIVLEINKEDKRIF